MARACVFSSELAPTNMACFSRLSKRDEGFPVVVVVVICSFCTLWPHAPFDWIGQFRDHSSNQIVLLWKSGQICSVAKLELLLLL